MFYSFPTQEERRNFGGSLFIEIAFCKLPSNTHIEKIVSPITAKLCEIKPADYEKPVRWLNLAKQYNGFYILGL